MFSIYSKYLSDLETSTFVSDENFIRKMLDVEIALANSQAQLGIIPLKAAEEITLVLKDFCPHPQSLIDGTFINGIPTIPLLALAKKELSEESKNYLHWGATSQDIIDTAQILLIKEVLEVFQERLISILESLTKLSQRYQQTPTVARTRTQQAVPIIFSQKIENWWKPLERHIERLEQLKVRLLIVQLGGAGGNLMALGQKGEANAKLLAQMLSLGYAGVWHSQRDNLVEFSSWMGLLAGSIGKMAQDILLLSQTEIGEVSERADGGKSSTMPHKNNPVLSEAIVALSKYVGQLAGGNFQTLLHQHERDGASWALEWLTYPQMMISTGSILNHTLAISQNLSVHKKALKANFKKLKGLIFSEKASFILTKYKSRQEAKHIVSEACALVMAQDIHLAEALKILLPEIVIDWYTLLTPSSP